MRRGNAAETESVKFGLGKLSFFFAVGMAGTRPSNSSSKMLHWCSIECSAIVSRKNDDRQLGGKAIRNSAGGHVKVAVSKV